MYNPNYKNLNSTEEYLACLKSLWEKNKTEEINRKMPLEEIIRHIYQIVSADFARAYLEIGGIVTVTENTTRFTTYYGKSSQIHIPRRENRGKSNILWHYHPPNRNIITDNIDYISIEDIFSFACRYENGEVNKAIIVGPYHTYVLEVENKINTEMLEKLKNVLVTIKETSKTIRTKKYQKIIHDNLEYRLLKYFNNNKVEFIKGLVSLAYLLGIKVTIYNNDLYRNKLTVTQDESKKINRGLETIKKLKENPEEIKELAMLYKKILSNLGQIEHFCKSEARKILNSYINLSSKFR